MESKVDNILQTHQLKRTSVRISVLELLIASNCALSQNEIEKGLKKKENRVTVFRVLKDFENAGIIHRIVSLPNTVLFALCHADCPNITHQDQHVHFSCRLCNKIYCLESLSVPELKFPQGFKASSLALSAVGICQNCCCSS